MKKNDPTGRKALLVADSSGHILERIALTWQRHFGPACFDVALSEEVSVAACCARAGEQGFVHWLDRHRAVKAAPLAPCPQAVMIYHHLPGEEEQVRSLAASCDLITTGARSWQIRLQDLTGRPVHRIPQTIDTQWYRPFSSADRELLRLKAGIPKDTFVLGFVAKLGANTQGRKGVSVFCQIAENLRINRPVGILLVGYGWDELAEALRQKGLQVWHHTPTHLRETREAYALMDVLVVTATEEGGPATVMEAMASAVPVVSSPVGHVPEMIVDGRTGILSAAQDVGGYLRAIGKLADDEAFSLALASAAREEMVGRWDDQKLTSQVDFHALRSEAERVFTARPAEELKWRQRRLARMLWRDRLAGWVRRWKA